MKQALLKKLLGAVSAFMCFTIAAPVSAGPPEFSICDGLSGAGWGLCRAGVAAGCADGTGNPTACGNIEDQFLQVTGNYPPWIIPPVTCPCDYNVLAKTLPPWNATSEYPLIFSCNDLGVFFSTSGGDPLSGTAIYAVSYYGGPYTESCETIEADIVLNYYQPGLSTEEYEACKQDLINYTQAFMALNPDVPVDDTCTPTL